MTTTGRGRPVGEHPSPDAPPSAPAPRKLLIVDDDPDLLEALEVVFGRDEIAIRTAEDGRSGLEMARDWTPDVILLDLHLPTMRGVEVVAELASGSLTPRIILTSALPRSEFAELKISLGAYEAVSKPFDISHLHALVLRALAEPKCAETPSSGPSIGARNGPGQGGLPGAAP